MVETSAIIEAVHFILNKIGATDRIKLIKLVYLADKYHLTRYGRSVTHDVYFAMERGPVGSTLKDVLAFNEIALNSHEYNYASQLIEQIDPHTFKAKEPDEVPEYDMLSETDIEALEFVIKHFGGKDQWELSEYTHKYPEWYNYADIFKEGRARRAKIKIEELLTVLEDDPLFISREHIEESRRILTGNLD